MDLCILAIANEQLGTDMISNTLFEILIQIEYKWLQCVKWQNKVSRLFDILKMRKNCNSHQQVWFTDLQFRPVCDLENIKSCCVGWKL